MIYFTKAISQNWLTCCICGKRFVRGHVSEKARKDMPVCSDNCREIRNRLIAQLRRHGKFKCRFCYESFTPRHALDVFCPECRKDPVTRDLRWWEDGFDVARSDTSLRRQNAEAAERKRRHIAERDRLWAKFPPKVRRFDAITPYGEQVTVEFRH